VPRRPTGLAADFADKTAGLSSVGGVEEAAT
jgi:hypothetical protein